MLSKEFSGVIWKGINAGKKSFEFFGKNTEILLYKYALSLLEFFHYESQKF